MTCWICGAPADSAEHEHKQTNITLAFGPGPYKKGRRLLRKNSNGSTLFIQGKDSKHLKYKKSLCKPCNNTRTKPYDEAYTLFISFINDHSSEILRTREISLNSIFGKQAKQQSKYLFKYFIKIFGCKLVDNGLAVPSELVNSIKNQKQEIPRSFLLTFSIYDEYPEKKYGLKRLLQSHNLERDIDKRTGETKITFAQSVAWFTVVYWYNHTINNNLGEPWYGKRKPIKLGCFT